MAQIPHVQFNRPWQGDDMRPDSFIPAFASNLFDFSSHMLNNSSEALDYRAVFDATLSPYLLLSLNFTVVDVNTAFLSAVHARRESIVGRHVFDLFPDYCSILEERYARNLRLSLERVIREHVTDFMAIQKYDMPCPVSGTALERYWSPVNKPVFAADGSLLAIIHRVEDVTEFVHRKNRCAEAEDEIYQRSHDVHAIHRELKLAKDNLERIVAQRTHELALSEEKFRLMANTMPQIVWTARPDGYVDWYNDCWYEFTGMPRGSDWDNSDTPVHPDDMQPLRDAWKESLATGKILEKDVRLKRQSDGEYCWHLSRAVPQRNPAGRIVSWIGTSTDIHERKKLADELQLAKGEAEEANRMKSAFLANMSHELRTPLTAITGFSQLLHEQKFSPELEKRYLSVIDRNGRQLLRIIDDILDLSKVEAGKLTIERIRMPLQEIISDVRAFLELKTQEAGLGFSVEIVGLIPEAIESDPTRLKQILMNLINNAVKFTSQGSVHIRVSYPMETEHLQFEILDTGRGVSPEQAAQLFEPFVQADSSITRTYGGTGLGLTLSRHLARALGGDVLLQSSELKKGSTFIARIDPGPMNGIRLIGDDASEKELCRQRQKALLEKFTGALKGRKILLVDDADDNRALISAILHRTQATLVTARDGIECLETAEAEDFDLTLMDMQMPRMDGFEATRILRQKGYSKPIVALTAHVMREQVKRCHEAGCTAHLSKPVNHGELIETVMKLMG
jgi:PAS domain S-box-containing protein